MGMGPLMSLLVILLLSAYAAPECLVPVAVLVLLLFSAAFFCLELEKFNLRKLLRVLCSDAETGYLLLLFLLELFLLLLVDFCPLALFFFFS